MNPEDPSDTDLPRNLLRTPKSFAQRMPVDKWKRSMHDVLLQSRRSVFPSPEAPEAAAPPPPPPAPAAKAKAAPAKGGKKAQPTA